MRFHDLRHTFATVALQNGVDIKTVSGMLGHYSAGFTLDTYAHVTTAASPAPYRGVEQLVARRAHNPEVAGSSPVPATSEKKVETLNLYLLFCCFVLYIVRYLNFETIYSIFLMDGAIRNS